MGDADKSNEPRTNTFRGTPSPAATARISVVEPDGAERVLNSKGSFDATAGSLVVFDVPGSGGYGPPAERDPERLREDLRDGYVTPEGAKRDCGVEVT